MIGLVQSTDSEGDTFCTLQNRRNDCQPPPAYHVGQEVEMVYNPQDLGRAAINKFAELWLLPAMIGGTVAVLFVTLNLVVIGGLFCIQSEC